MYFEFMYIVYMCNIFSISFLFYYRFCHYRSLQILCSQIIYGSWYAWLGRFSAPQGYKNILLYFLLQVIHCFVVVVSKIFFLEQWKTSQWNWEKSTDFLYVAFPHTCIAPFIINITFLNGAFLSRMNLYRYIIIIQSP